MKEKWNGCAKTRGTFKRTFSKSVNDASCASSSFGPHLLSRASLWTPRLAVGRCLSAKILMSDYRSRTCTHRPFFFSSIFLFLLFVFNLESARRFREMDIIFINQEDNHLCSPSSNASFSSISRDAWDDKWRTTPMLFLGNASFAGHVSARTKEFQLR